MNYFYWYLIASSVISTIAILIEAKSSVFQKMGDWVLLFIFWPFILLILLIAIFGKWSPLVFLPFFFFLGGCTTYQPPNVDVCVAHESYEHCAMTIQGADFNIDDQHHYKLYGQDLTKEQYDQVALRISPWAYATVKKNWLNYCHAHQSACNYSLAVKMLTDFENQLGLEIE